MSDTDIDSARTCSALGPLEPGVQPDDCGAVNDSRFNRVGQSSPEAEQPQVNPPVARNNQGVERPDQDRGIDTRVAPLPAEASEQGQVVPEVAQAPCQPIPPELLEPLDSIADKLGVPVDRPRFARALSAVATAVRYLEGEIAGAAQASLYINQFAPLARQTAAPGAARKPLSKRRDRHLLYALLVDLGQRLEADAALNQQALQIVAAWSMRALLTGWLPASRPLALVSAVLIRPDSTIAKSWTSRGRGKCLRLALTSLSAAIEANPQAARGIGLVVTDSPSPSLLTEMERASLLVRKRLNGLQANAARRAVGGAGGHGTLAAETTAEFGQELLEGMLARDKQALLNYLWTVTHLSEHVTAELRVVRGMEDPEDAIAWIAIDTGEYCYRLYKLEERGAGPGCYSLSNFEATEQVVRLRLSPVAAEMLLEVDLAGGRMAGSIRELLGQSGVSARSSVKAGKAYRTTVRRVQESLPVLLLERGGNRWPILLATSSPFLASVGRHSYGSCPNRAIQAEFGNAHELLRLPRPVGPIRDGLIGSRITPKKEAVQCLVGHLREQADRNWAGLADRQSVIRSIRAVAPWMSCVEALSLARRKRLVYQGTPSVVEGGQEMLVNDKQVHELAPIPLPVCTLLERANACYRSMLQRALDVICRYDDAESQEMVEALRALIENTAGSRVLAVDAAGRLVAAGYLTWHDAAPPSLRLPGHFARQFWPLQALILGLPQRVLDVLMRHQLADLHLGGRTATVAKKHIRARLLQMLDHAMSALQLELPSCLSAFAK